MRDETMGFGHNRNEGINLATLESRNGAFSATEYAYFKDDGRAFTLSGGKKRKKRGAAVQPCPALPDKEGSGQSFHGAGYVP